MSKLFRNKEVITFFLMLMTVSLLALLSMVLLTNLALPIFIIYVIVIFGLFYSMLYSRYQKLNKLNGYLRDLNSQSSTLVFDDLLEGELSILKSELYKVTVMIHQQNQTLSHEKDLMAKSLADISHQIKTPLTSLSMMMDLLSDESLTTQQKHNFIQQSIQQLQRIKFLVQALLKMATLQSGNFKIIKLPIDPNLIVKEAQVALGVLLDLYQVNLVSQVECESILCDLTWTQEAINNVVKNAIEHSFANEQVALTIKKDTIGYKIIISNKGETIDNHQLKRIFDRFYKSSNSRVDSIGIGLALAKEIIEKQHGFIDVTSQENQTNFIITLPFS